MGSSINIDDLLRYMIKNKVISTKRLVEELQVLIQHSSGLKKSSTDGFLIKEVRTIVVASDLLPLYEIYLTAHELAHLVLDHDMPYMYSEHRMTALPEEVDADIVAFIHVLLYMDANFICLNDATEIADKIGVPHSRVSNIQKALNIINHELARSGYDYAQ